MRILATRRPRLPRRLAAVGLALVFLSLTASDASAQFGWGRGGWSRGGWGRGFYGGGFYNRGLGFYNRPRFYNRGFVGGNFGPRYYSRGFGGVYGSPWARPYVGPRGFGGWGYTGGMFF
jgi:hypothetical protein